MGHRLFAVLVPASTTTATVDVHLDALLRPLLRAHVIDDYWLGGQVTGAWDPAYEPGLDPANWSPCSCDGTDPACPLCGDAVTRGRTPGTILTAYFGFKRFPGDVVPLSRLLNPGWRFPRGRTPIAWLDPAGLIWLDTQIAVLRGTDGPMPALLRQVFDHLASGRRRLRGVDRFDPADWAVAVVDTHH